MHELRIIVSVFVVVVVVSSVIRRLVKCLFWNVVEMFDGLFEKRGPEMTFS